MATALNNPAVDTTGRGLILLTLCLGVLMVQVDTSVVNLAVHAIGVVLHAPLTALQWVSGRLQPDLRYVLVVGRGSG